MRSVHFLSFYIALWGCRTRNGSFHIYPGGKTVYSTRSAEPGQAQSTHAAIDYKLSTENMLSFSNGTNLVKKLTEMATGRDT